MKKYIMKRNGKYYGGIDYDAEPVGKASHMGWQPNANGIEPMILTDKKDEAKIIDCNINLKSELDRVYHRMRYAGFELRTLEVERGG